MSESKELFGEYYNEAEKYLQKMTLEEKIAQMFFIRYNETKAIEEITKKKLGGFVLYAIDFKCEENYIINKIKELQNLSIKFSNLPLGFAVDEEGGTVNRVSRYHREKGKFPSPQEIYNKSGMQGIIDIENEKINLLKKFNLNINLAPVADISINSNDFIYSRTLGKKVEETSNYIGKVVEEYAKNNFSCCAKHFPGYGNNVDTHGEISVDKRSYETFLKEDLKPFETAIANKIPMILFSHNIVECKDKKYPCTLSKIWNDILRNDLNYSGLILTDDLCMGAIKKLFENESPAVLAVKAGDDILLTGDFDKHYNDVIIAVKSGDISEDIINKACRRIISWKLKYLLNFQH